MTKNGNDGKFTVINDASSFIGEGLGQKWNLGGSVQGFTPDPDTSFNMTYQYNPFTNYTANDLTNDLIVQATQVHELGNSLARITGIFGQMNGTIFPPQFGRDQDPGVAMERCVFGGDVSSDGKILAPGSGSIWKRP